MWVAYSKYRYLFNINSLFSEDLSQLAKLSHLCIGFFGQLIARPRSMQGYILYLSPDMQVSHHSTLTLWKRVRPCLPCLVLATTICAALLCASFVQSYPAQGKGRIKKIYPNPARPRSVPYDIFGHPSWPKEASPRT